MSLSDDSPSSGHEAAFRLVYQDWLSIEAGVSPVPDWELEFADMVDEMRRLRASGQWRTGSRTLLHALGVHHDEVRLCRALAWLMTPDGWHGLGDTFLRRLLERVGVEVTDTSAATVTTEETRAWTRADLVTHVGSNTVLIEAKVYAGEQPTQADRLASEWAEEYPTLVFLTRDGGIPATAVASQDQWISLTWAEVAKTLETVVTEVPAYSPGVLEFLQTLQRYGG